MYNQTRTKAGFAMPLLMGCTTPSHISKTEAVLPLYDPMNQKTIMELGTVGTKSLQTTHYVDHNSAGGRVSKTDKKNEIDDQKSIR